MRPSRAVWLVPLALFCGGCLGFHKLAFNPDADLRHDERWLTNTPPPDTFDGMRHSVWFRIRDEKEHGFDLDHLASRLEQRFTRAGWHVTGEAQQADLWLDIHLRFWGENPNLDDGDSAFANLSDGLDTDSTSAGSRARRDPVQRSAPTAAKILLPGIPQASSAAANTREWNLVLDLRFQRRSKPLATRRDTLLCWVRRIDLDTAEATDLVSEYAPRSILASLF